MIALLVIGPGKREVGSALGKSVREFRKVTTDPIEPAEPTVAAAAPTAPAATVSSVALAPVSAVPTETDQA